MRSIGTYELKAHLSRVLDEVEGGERILVTRNGKPVAEIVPYEERMSTEELIARIRAIRERSKKVSIEEILEWRHEGHRI
jgi:prevent-host-death family protein